MLPEWSTESPLENTREALLFILEVSDPVVPPAPICKVPAFTVVTPE